MKATLTSFFLLIPFLIFSQCFDPPNGYTLYTPNGSVDYGTVSNAGFHTFGLDSVANYSVTSSSGVVTTPFIPNDARTSLFTLSGNGTLSIEAEITSPPTSMSPLGSCTHNYTVTQYNPTVASNNNLSASCPLKLVLLLDKSFSIADNGSVDEVRDAVMALVTNLEGTGSTMALIEFESRAYNVELNGATGLQAIDAAYSSAVNSYLINDYVPQNDPPNLVGGTNWEAALSMAGDIADDCLILILTDGVPTYYNTGIMRGGVEVIAGAGTAFDLTALAEANAVANTLKSSGSKIFVAGLDFPTNVQPIIDISGSVQLPSNPTLADFMNSDYSLTDPSSVVGLFGQLGRLCDEPEPEPIPTLGEWGLILLFQLLLILGVVGYKEVYSSKVFS